MKIAVILGNRMNDDGTLSRRMLARLDLALKLYAEQSPDFIIVSGGVANKKAGIPEAAAMKDWLVKNGIPDSKIIKEDRSLSTKQNAWFTVPILKEMKTDKLIICTSREHLNRKFLNPIRLFRRALQKQGCELAVNIYTD